MEKIKIYVLIDPLSLKIRYIGITSSTLIKRLGKHIEDALYTKSKKSSYKRNWINKLLKGGRFPIIRKIHETDNWDKALKIERCLIEKYKTSKNLTNYEEYDEGGSFGRKLTYEEKVNASIKMKEWYLKGGKAAACKKIRYFNRDAKYLGTFDSITEACLTLKISHRHISLVLEGVKTHVKNYIFRYIEDSRIVEVIPPRIRWSTSKPIKSQNLLTGEISSFESRKDLAESIGITSGLINFHMNKNKGIIKSKNIKIII